MTNFISASTPLQPAFIYASYPPGVNATGNLGSGGATDASAVLQADEASGWTFSSNGSNGQIVVTYPSPAALNCLALVGSGLTGATIGVFGSNDSGATWTQLLPYTAAGNDAVFWAQHTTGAYASFMYSFAGFAAGLTVKHIAGALLAPLPFLDDGACTGPLQAEGSHLISYTGLYLGSVTQRVMRPFSLSFGQVTPVEKELFDAVMAAGLQNARGLFFVPDTGLDEVHFGWIDKTYKYEPKLKVGLYELAAIPFTARAI